MALKKRNKASASFSMSSMTDLVFLLLIFFMFTVVTPSAIKLLLPQSSSQATAKPLTRVYIDEHINFYVAEGKNQERQVAFEDIEPFLQSVVLAEPEMYIALYADESVPYREIVKVLNIANKNKFKLVIATRPVRE